MIAADTSAWIDFSKGKLSTACEHLERALIHGTLVMPLPVLFEILSSPGLHGQVAEVISQVPQLELKSGFWLRAAKTRSFLLRKGRKARAMDCLIAQICLDYDVPLITTDNDFRHFVKFGLHLSTEK